MEWGGAATDPDGNYYANLNEIPWLYKMIPTRRPDGTAFSLGERTYIIQCGSCHGLDQRGDAASGVPSLLGIREKRTQAQVTEVVEKGIGRMPPFSQLQEGQRRAVIDFLFGVEQAPAVYAAPGRGGGGAPGAFGGGPGRGPGGPGGAAHTPAHLIKVTALQDGTFTVTNTRNNFSKTYRPRP
jgi:quinoprotein glucose dehydrogenase